MNDLLFFIPIIYIAYLAGRMIMARMHCHDCDDFSKTLFIPLGLVLISYAVYLIGTIGLLYKSAIIIFFGLIVWFCRSQINRPRFPALSITNFSQVDIALISIILLFAGVTLLGALAPAIGTDSLCYHLGIPKKFILQNKISFVPYTMNSLYPFFVEVLFTVGIMLRGAVLAKLFHWFSGILLVISVCIFAKYYCGRRWMLIAGLLTVSSPGIFNEMVYAYVDVTLALYVALSVFCFLKWEKERKMPDIALSGLFLGVALSIKYTAVYAAVPLFLLILWSLFFNKEYRQLRAKTFLIFLAPCFLLSFFWYLKSYVVLGNPIFPAFPDFFDMPIKFEMAHHFQKGMGKGILQLLLLPWNLATHPSGFGHRGSQLGVQFSLFLPFLYFGFRTFSGWFRKLGFFLIVYVLFWFYLAQKDRFLYPVLPLLSIMIAVSLHALFSKTWKWNVFFRTTAVILLAGATMFNLAICVYHNRQNYRVSLGLETRREFLERWVPNYSMAEYVNSEVEDNARILGIAMYKPYYFDRWLIRESVLDKWEGHREKFKTHEEMVSYLKELGFTHVIYRNIGPEVTPPPYVRLIISDKKPIFSYGPVRNMEIPQKEEYSLYVL